MVKDSSRPRRVAELLQRELATLIPREIHDPRVRPVTLTGVDVSPDLASAKVYFTCLGGASEARGIVEALNHAAGFLRHHLRGRLELRGVPALRFIYDASVERGAELSRLIDQAVSQDRGKGGKND